MAFATSDILFHWDQSYGANARKTSSYPVYARNGTSYEVDENGIYYPLVRNVFPGSIAKNLGKKTSAYRSQPARSNLLFWAQPEATHWVASTCTSTPGIDDPANGTSAVRLTTTSAGGSFSRVLDVAPATGVNSMLACVRKGTGVVSMIGWYDVTVGFRHMIQIAWGATQNDTPTITSFVGAGALGVPRLNSNGYWEIPWKVNSVNPANSNQIYVEPAGNTASGTMDLYFVQPEAADFSTGFIGFPSGSIITRPSDLLYWDKMFAPQNFISYLRYYDGGDTATGVLSWRWWLGDLAGGVPTIRLSDAANGAHQFSYYSSASDHTVTAPALGPLYGEMVEVIAAITNGGLDMRLMSCKSGGTPVVSTLIGGGVAFPAALIERKFILGAAGGSRSFAQYDKAFFMKTANMVTNPMTGTTASIFAEMRDVWVNANGELV